MCGYYSNSYLNVPGVGSAGDNSVALALFSKWTMILSYHFPNAMKIHKFIQCNTLVMG